MHHEVQEHFSQIHIAHEGAFLDSSEVALHVGQEEGWDPNGPVQSTLGPIVDHSDVLRALGHIKERCERNNDFSIVQVTPVQNLLKLFFHQGFGVRVSVL